MTTITKERLLTIKQWRETYGPGSNVVLPAEEAEELARIALASLEAKPIGAFHIAEQQVDGTSDYIKDGEWPIDNGIIEVYAAPPVPVVPEEKPMPNRAALRLQKARNEIKLVEAKLKKQIQRYDQQDAFYAAIKAAANEIGIWKLLVEKAKTKLNANES